MPIKISDWLYIFLEILKYNSFTDIKINKDMSLVRKPAPKFEAPAWHKGDFHTLKLSDYKGKYLLLFFYPLDFTFVCPTEIISFSNKAK